MTEAYTNAEKNSIVRRAPAKELKETINLLYRPDAKGRFYKGTPAKIKKLYRRIA